MAEAERPTTSALATRSGRDGALDAALDRLAPGRVADRSDTPDLHVTAVRRLPAIAPTYAEFPTVLDPRLRQALATRGVTAPFVHQAAAIDHALYAERSLLRQLAMRRTVFAFPRDLFPAVRGSASATRPSSTGAAGAGSGAAAACSG